MKLSGKWLGVACLAAASLSLVWVGATKADRQNRRFAACMAEMTGSEVDPLYLRVTNMVGETVGIDPVLRTYGTEIFGRRPGLVVDSFTNHYPLALVLEKNESGYYEGRWDFVRVSGFPIFTYSGIAGGNVTATSQQNQIGEIAETCANDQWVQRSPEL